MLHMYEMRPKSMYENKSQRRDPRVASHDNAFNQKNKCMVPKADGQSPSCCPSHQLVVPIPKEEAEKWMDFTNAMSPKNLLAHCVARWNLSLEYW